MNDAVTQQVRQFIQGHIRSVAQLDMLLLLHSNPHRAWTVDQVARELRIDAGGARSSLYELEASGLVDARDDGSRIQHHYQPETDILASAVGAVARAYMTRRVTIIGLIFSEPDHASNEGAAHVDHDSRS